ncbi:hypothetical protein [Hydrogenophaga sp.]|uniref:hypothetical protein n=1 Tax=Hydrogenophaga sp. TaxID=1904254 RepID=UPI002717A489|nr:hypothetical protein [Hydrogenophaga sp.]MDO9434443.1 hypothetical protein [Hydrogenophaga sp.]
MPITISEPGKVGTPSDKAQQDLVITLKQVESEQAQTAQFLDQANAVRTRADTLLATPTEGMTQSQVSAMYIEVINLGLEFRNLEAKAYGLEDTNGESNSVAELNAMLGTLRGRLDSGSLSPAQVEYTNKRMLMVEEALFVATNHVHLLQSRERFVESKIAEWEKKASDLRHVLTQDGWTPENRKPVEDQIRALEDKVKEGEAFLRGHLVHGLALPMIG